MKADSLLAICGRSLLGCALALIGCAPVASLRPASGLMPGRSVEVGLGGAATSPRPFVEEEWHGVGQVWMLTDLSPELTLSAIGVFDTDAAALGGALRWNALRTSRFAGGVEAELGYAWAALSLPGAVRLFDQTWVYTAPRLGTWSTDAIFGLPGGVSARVYDGFVLRAEAQVSWQDFQRFNRRTHLAAGAAYQF